MIISTAIHCACFLPIALVGGMNIKHGVAANDVDRVLIQLGEVSVPLSEKVLIDKLPEPENDRSAILADDNPGRKKIISPKKEVRKNQAKNAIRGRSGLGEKNSGGFYSEYVMEVRRRIEQAKYYPREARRRFIADKVEVSFKVNENGMAENIYIINPSRYGIFNNAAEDIILKASPFPKPCENLLPEIQIVVVFNR